MAVEFKTRWLGPLEYGEALKLQNQITRDIQNGGPAWVLGLEHPEVITLGVRAREGDVKPAVQAPVVRVDRGGQATLHNLGQLVIYPLIPIKKWDFGAREWVDLLLRTTQQSLEKCNIIIKIQNNGLHSKTGKIGSLGINIQKGISSHGLAINVNNDLRDFEKIRPCGIDRQAMDRVGNHCEISTEALFHSWCALFNQRLRFHRDRSLTSPGPGL